jgi:hypothetical protein
MAGCQAYEIANCDSAKSVFDRIIPLSTRPSTVMIETIL